MGAQSNGRILADEWTFTDQGIVCNQLATTHILACTSHTLSTFHDYYRTLIAVGIHSGIA